MTTHHHVEKDEICDRYEAGRKRETAMAESKMKSKKPVQPKIHRDGKKTDEHGQMALIESIKCRGENFDARVASKTERIKAKRRGSLKRGRGSETPMLINQTYDRFCQNDQPDRGRNREQHHEPHGVRKSAAKLGRITESRTPGNQRQRNRRDGDAENSERQLHQPERNVQPSHRSVA